MAKTRRSLRQKRTNILKQPLAYRKSKSKSVKKGRGATLKFF